MYDMYLVATLRVGYQGHTVKLRERRQYLFACCGRIFSRACDLSRRPCPQWRGTAAQPRLFLLGLGEQLRVHFFHSLRRCFFSPPLADRARLAGPSACRTIDRLMLTLIARIRVSRLRSGRNSGNPSLEFTLCQADRLAHSTFSSWQRGRAERSSRRRLCGKSQVVADGGERFVSCRHVRRALPSSRCGLVRAIRQPQVAARALWNCVARRPAPLVYRGCGSAHPSATVRFALVPLLCLRIALRSSLAAESVCPFRYKFQIP